MDVMLFRFDEVKGKTAHTNRMPQHRKFALVLGAIQVSFIVIFACVVTYHPSATGIDKEGHGDGYYVGNYFSFFQDVHAMIFFGIGFLLTFIKKYGYSGLSMNLLLGVISMQVGFIVQNVWHTENGKIQLNLVSLIMGEFAAASALIAFGGILGKASPLQMVFFAIFETVFYAVNEHWCFKLLQVVDLGESVALHAFAAIFGVTVAFVMDKGKNVQNNPNDCGSYSSDITCLLGTVFLWCFWPGFNTAVAPLGSQQITAINTFLALFGSCISVFVISSLLHRRGKFTVTHVQNATLAGGVAIGASANLRIQPSGALGVGCIGGIISVLGYNYVSPFLARRSAYDISGIFSLHGLPGIAAGIIGGIAASTATFSKYGYALYEVYPAMAPEFNTTEYFEVQENLPNLKAGDGRSSLEQAGYQFLYIVITICTSILSGLITGAILRLPFFEPLEELDMYLDKKYFAGLDEDQNETDKSNHVGVTKC